MCHVIYMQAYISLYYNNPFRYHDYVFKYINKSTSGYTHMCHRNKHGCGRKNRHHCETYVIGPTSRPYRPKSTHRTQNICVTFVQRRPNVFTLSQHCTNVIQMFCVYWVFTQSCQ